jgi:zinc transporter
MHLLFFSSSGELMAISDNNYGTDKNGLICGFLLSPNTTPRELGSEEAVQWLTAQKDIEGEDFLWLHFNLSHSYSEKWLTAHANLPEEFFDTLREDSHSTRIERVESSLLAVVNDVHYDFSFEASEISTLWLSVAQRVVISARLRPLRSIDALRESVRRGEIIRSPLALLIHLLHEQENVLVSIMRRVTVRIDSVEDKLLAGKVGVTRAELGSLRRLLVRLQRLLAPEPASLFRLLQAPPEWTDETDSMPPRLDRFTHQKVTR